MRALLAALAVAGVLALFAGMFALSDFLRRRGRRRVKDVDALQGPTEEIPTSHAPAEAIRRIEAAFAARNAAVTHRSDAEIVLFVGKGGGSLQFGGIAGARPEQMPLLIAAKAREGRVKLVVDNDFGWNLFAGPAKAAYLSLVKEAVGAAQEAVRRALAE